MSPGQAAEYHWCAGGSPCHCCCDADYYSSQWVEEPEEPPLDGDVRYCDDFEEASILRKPRGPAGSE